MSRAVIRLADLEQPLGDVELPGGRVIGVRAIDGVAMQQRQELMKGDDPMLIWDIAARCLPDASREEVLALSHVQARRIIEIAAGMADLVLDELGKGTGATAGTTAPDAPVTS